MKKLILALFIGIVAFISPALASTCFWVPIVVSGAASGTAGVCRLTITAITGSGLLAGDSVIVAGIVGATACNGTTTISTVVDSTHIELTGTTFGTAYVSGGTVAGGHWTTTNTAMWASGTGGTVGTCAATGGVPKQAADTATFDASSGGGTVTVDSTINGVTLTEIVSGAFTGTLDFSVNNPSITLTGAPGFSSNGTGTRTIKLGSGTFTLSGGNGSILDLSTSTNLTFIGGTATLLFNGAPLESAGSRTINLGSTTGLTFPTITISNTGSSGASTNINGASTVTVTTLNLIAPMNISFAANFTLTITNVVTWAGTSSSNAILLFGGNNNTAPTVHVASGSTCTWCGLYDMTFSGSAFNATNAFDFKGNNLNGGSISPPSGGGGGHIIGG